MEEESLENKLRVSIKLSIEGPNIYTIQKNDPILSRDSRFYHMKRLPISKKNNKIS